MTTLFLQSPHIGSKANPQHKADVEHLQKLLAKKGWYHGKIDGEYGDITAQAAYRAKYWLGYVKPDKKAGDKLLSFLEGRRKPSLYMRGIVKQRMAANRKKVGNKDKILKRALGEIGNKEHPPNTNISKYSTWYGMIGAWCAMFVTWVMYSFYSIFKRGERFSYVPTMLAYARLGQKGFTITLSPKSCDVTTYDWDKDGIADHTGIYIEEADLKRLAMHHFVDAVKAFGPLGNHDFWAIEGNTAVGNDSNGGEVMLRKRNKSLVSGFIHVS